MVNSVSARIRVSISARQSYFYNCLAQSGPSIFLDISTAFFVAKNYARALFGFLERDFETRRGALAFLVSALEASPELAAALAHPGIDRRRREALCACLFGPGFPPEIQKVFTLLARRRKLRLLPAILTSVDALWRELKSIRAVEITTAFGLGDEDQALMKQRVSGMLGRVELIFREDPGLIAGVRIRMGEMYVENSLADRLSKLRRRIRGLSRI
jgi:F-type H+-transporting ATPase subunit delta